MNTTPQTSMGSQPVATAANPLTRPFYWSVWRELWENKSIYVAPVVVSTLGLFGFFISTIGLAERRRAVLLLSPDQQRAAIERPYDFAATALIFTAFVVGVFYCLDALRGERRDRSILFWKSLPVSDLTTVLSKLSIPLVVLPAITFVVVVALQMIMRLWSSAVLVAHDVSPVSTWIHVPIVQGAVILLYGLIALALWHAPIYAWLLLVSGWARRAAFLWAILPLTLGPLERIAFGTSYIGHLIIYRLGGGMKEAFVFNPHGRESIHSFAQLTPGRYLSSLGLWLGLIVGAGLIGAAVRLRRYKGPI
jgi:ABC-2 type transport system permease protein